MDLTLDILTSQTVSFVATFSARIDEALGLPWLMIRPTLTFTPEGKSLSGWVSLRIREVGCVTPLFTNLWHSSYFSSSGSAPDLDAFDLYGLHGEFRFGNVTLRAGTYLDDFRLSVFDSRGNLKPLSHPLYGVITVPPGYRTCGEPPGEYDEFIGILVNEEGCCGGRTSGSVFVWFADLGPDASSWVFNIAEFDIDGSVALSDRLTLRGGLRLTEAEGLIDLLIGIEVAF